MNSNRYIWILAWCMYVNTSVAQNAIERAIDYLETKGNSENWNDPWALRQTLENYIQTPLNLNHADFDALMGLPLFRESLAINLLYYRKRGGAIREFQELRFIRGFDTSFITLIKPFCTLEKVVPQPHLLEDLKHSTSQIDLHCATKLPIASGFGDQKFNGIPIAYQARYLIDLGLSGRAGIRSQTDLGELPFDHLGGSIGLNFSGPLQSIIVGDFTLRSALGLTFGLGAMQNTPGSIRGNEALKPSFSGDEFNFLRGCALGLHWKSWTLSTFFSTRRLDVSLNSEHWSTLQTSGLHRTSSEIANKKQLKMNEIGQSIAFQMKNHTLGFNLYYAYWSIPEKEKFFGYERNNRLDYSLFTKHRFGKIGLTSEFIPTSNPSYSLALQANLKDGFNLGLFNARVQDDLPRTARPEIVQSQGMMSGIKLSYTGRIQWTMLYQINTKTKREALKNVTSHFLRLEANTTWKSSGIYMRLTQTQQDGKILWNHRVQIEWRISDQLSLRTRHEGTYWEDKHSELIFNELKFNLETFSLSIRHTLLSASTLLPIYGIEPTAPFESGMTTYNYPGSKVNVLFRINNTTQSYWLSLAYAQRNDRETFGSSYDATESSHLWEIHLQYRVRF